MLVETVYRYRTLQGKCDLGIGLDWDEIEQMTAMEEAFAPSRADRRMGAARKFTRSPVQLVGLMRGDRIHDRIEIIELAMGGLVVRNAPFVARGEQVEIVIESGDDSFRFCAEGVWLRDDADDYKVGLVFRGMPVCVHRAILSAPHEHDIVHQIARAA